MQSTLPMIMGDHRFSDNCVFDGMISGTATVAKGIEIGLRGMVAGDLVIEAGAVVNLTGMIGGDVINNGGKINSPC